MVAVSVTLPTLHADQVKAFWLPGRFKAIRCGRRWGKTKYGETIAGDGAIKKELIGWFAPDHKRWSEVFTELEEILRPIKRRSSKNEGIIETKTGGRIEFWTLDDESAGRSRKYHKAIVDEGAFTKPNMIDIWEKAIKPTLLDYSGSCTVLSNTNGVDPQNFFWKICNDPKLGFREYHAPTHNNPIIPERMKGESVEAWLIRRQAELDALARDNAPLVYQQEYLAEFVDWSGVAFFSKDKLLVDGLPVEMPTICDMVFAIVDTATKAGREHDGTGVIYFASSNKFGHPLVILGYDLVQIEGALLETWLPTVFENLERYAKICGARYGSVGAHIEDKSSGMVLLQKAAKAEWPATPIDSKLTSLGKDERAINASGPVYRGEVKVTREAYDHIVTFKGDTRNHLMSQVAAFRIGDKDAAKRADDLLDCFCYGIALSLGNGMGF